MFVGVGGFFVGVDDGVGDGGDVTVDAAQVADDVEVKIAGGDALGQAFAQTVKMAAGTFNFCEADAALVLDEAGGERGVFERKIVCARRRF